MAGRRTYVFADRRPVGDRGGARSPAERVDERLAGFGVHHGEISHRIAGDALGVDVRHHHQRAEHRRLIGPAPIFDVLGLAAEVGVLDSWPRQVRFVRSRRARRRAGAPTSESSACADTIARRMSWAGKRSFPILQVNLATWLSESRTIGHQFLRDRMVFLWRLILKIGVVQEGWARTRAAAGGPAFVNLHNADSD